MSDDSSDSSFDLFVDDDDDDDDYIEEEEEKPTKVKKRSKYTHITQYGMYLRHAKRPIFSAELPFEELNRALNIMQTTCKTKRKKYCETENDLVNSFVGMTNIHYCHLIKRAILKHEWYKIPRLLISFIDEEKHLNANHVIFAKYSMIYLLNDPVAKKNKLLTELLKTALSSKKDKEIKNFLKNCISSQHFSKNISNVTKC